MEGKDLLVSDLPTGTSDPVVLLWVGSCQEGDIDLRKDKRVQVNKRVLFILEKWVVATATWPNIALNR